MGDTRFEQPYERVREARNRAEAMRSLRDDEVVSALAAASKHHDPYLANVLATEVQNRVGIRTTLLNHMGDGVYVLDEQGLIIAANPRIAQMLGHPPEHLVGKEIHALTACAFVEDDDRSRASCPVLDTVRTGRPHEGDARYRRADGRDALLSVNVTSIQRDGDPWRAVVVLRDVAERRRAEQAAQQLAAIVESSEDAIVVRSPEGTITQWNPAATRLFGYAPHEIVGRHIHEIIPPPLHHLERQLRERVLRGERVAQQEVQGLRKDGRSLHLSATLSPVKDGRDRVVAVASILRDVSGQKTLERRLKTMSLAGFSLALGATAALALLRRRADERRGQ